MEASGHDGARVARAYGLALSRPPSDAERDRARTHLARIREALEAEKAKPEEIDLEAWSSLARVLLMSNEFLYVD
jgi:hypothetical protein